MRRTFYILASALLSCFPAVVKADIPRKVKMRVTYYAKCPRYGDQISSDPNLRAKTGRTVAVDPRLFPYGTIMVVPDHGVLLAEDTGSAVKSRKASRRHGKIPVLDVYVARDAEVDRMSREMPEVMEVQVVLPVDDEYQDLIEKYGYKSAPIKTASHSRRRNKADVSGKRSTPAPERQEVCRSIKTAARA